MAIIDPSWEMLQTGLYKELVTEYAGSLTITYTKLHSADGYCFYDLLEEVYDEEGNVIPPEDVQPNQRIYSQYAITPITDNAELNARFISVPVDPSYEIISVTKPNEKI